MIYCVQVKNQELSERRAKRFLRTLKDSPERLHGAGVMLVYKSKGQWKRIP